MESDLAMKPPVAILFANLKGNIGDFAILHAMLLDLKRTFPGQPLHVFSHGFYNIDERRLTAFRASSDVEFELIGTTYFHKGAPKLLERFVRLFGLWPVAQGYLVQSLTDRVTTHASQFREYDAIFLAGGDHWGGVRCGISMFATLNAMHLHNSKIFTFPFSVNPGIGKYNSRRALQRNFRKLREPLIVRDGITKGVMDKLGIETIVGGDSVFSMQDLADDIKPMESRDRARILFVLTGSSKKLEADLKAALRRVGQFNGGIALMTTCELEDGKRGQAVAQEFGIPFYAPATWQEAVAEMKASSLLVTNRLHGLILGVLANTPLLPVANRKKTEAFVKDAQMPHSAANMHALTSGLIKSCLADRDAILERMHHYQALTRNQARSPLADALG